MLFSCWCLGKLDVFFTGSQSHAACWLRRSIGSKEKKKPGVHWRNWGDIATVQNLAHGGWCPGFSLHKGGCSDAVHTKNVLFSLSLFFLGENFFFFYLHGKYFTLTDTGWVCDLFQNFLWIRFLVCLVFFFRSFFICIVCHSCWHYSCHFIQVCWFCWGIFPLDAKWSICPRAGVWLGGLVIWHRWWGWN